MTTSKTIEIVSFKLADGVSVSAFLQLLPLTSTFLEKCDGFISRHLSRGDEGEWVDHIEWASMADAQSAAQKFMADATLKPFMEKIDGASVIMRHNQLLHAETT